MTNIYGNTPTQTWTDPATGVVYDAATMEPLPVAGDDLGELPGHSTELTDIDQTEIDDFVSRLGIDPESH